MDLNTLLVAVTILSVCLAVGAAAYAVTRGRAVAQGRSARAAVDALPEGLLFFERGGRLSGFNPAAQKLLGGSALNQGMTLTELAAEWPALVDFLAANTGKAPARAALLSPAADEMEVRLEDGPDGGFWLLLRDGSEIERAKDEARQAREALAALQQENEALQASLNEQAVRDPLTGLYNRGYLDETLEREMARARRSAYEIGVMMVNIDHFKAFNETYGNKAGDDALRTLGNFLPAYIRQNDMACRYAGEEFVVVLPDVPLATTQARAEEICRQAEHLVIEHRGQELNITLSVGVASFPKHGESADALLRAADLALYQAKREGRNRVCVAGQEA